MWLGDILHSEWDCDSPPWLGMRKPGCSVGKTPCLRIWTRQICTPLSSLVRVYHWFVSADKLSFWFALLLGHHSINLVFPNLCAHCCKPSPLLLHSQILSSWVPQIPLQSSWDEIKVGRGYHKATDNEAVLVLPSGFSFPSVGSRCWIKTSSCDAGCWSERRAMPSTRNCFTYTFNAVCLGLCGMGWGGDMLQPQPVLYNFSGILFFNSYSLFFL